MSSRAGNPQRPLFQKHCEPLDLLLGLAALYPIPDPASALAFQLGGGDLSRLSHRAGPLGTQIRPCSWPITDPLYSSATRIMWDSGALTRSLSGTQSGHLTLTEINLTLSSRSRTISLAWFSSSTSAPISMMMRARKHVVLASWETQCWRAWTSGGGPCDDPSWAGPAGYSESQRRAHTRTRCNQI